MTSFQSTLGDGVAEELAESQREISIAEFFEKNKQMLGFDSGAKALVTAVKEGVDNALDATEEAGILPDVYVEIAEVGDYYRVTIEDNGPGITRDQIPKIFGKLLYGSRFHVREQNRGQQGIGISAAVLFSQLTSGKPARITSRTKGSAEAQYFELIIDTDQNEPEVSVAETTSWERPHGTRIELEMEANMRARSQLHDYVKHTAVVNPHARIELKEPKEHFKFERVEGAELPAETEEIRPHPHGVELGTLLKMLEATSSHSVSGFLQEEFTRVGRKTADSVVERFKDRHYGREMGWRPPGLQDDADLATAIADAVANKGKAATRTFVEYVVEGTYYDAGGSGKEYLQGVVEHERITHHELVAVVDAAADLVEAETEKSFGSTVRENAVEAAWTAITSKDADGEGDDGDGDGEKETAESPLAPDLYPLVDDATSSQKDDATVHGLADRLARKFENAEDPRHRASRATLAEYVDRSADATEEYDDATVGETARENVVAAVRGVMRTVPDDPPLVREVGADRNVARELLEAMRGTDIMAPPTNCLSPISAELVEAGLRKEFDAEFYAATTRDAEVHGGDPFIVEAGIAYGGDVGEEGEAEVLRFANRVPLVYQRGACATTDVVRSIGWRNYGLDQPGGHGVPVGPAVVMVHVASTNVPFTSESKDAIANIPAIEDEIELAIREAARELKSFLNKRRSLEKRRQKQNVIATILPQMATKLSETIGREEPDYGDALARIMNNVLVERRIEENGDAERVSLTVENHTDSGTSPELTDIVSAEPTDLEGGATVVDMDGEWFVRWAPFLNSGEDATVEYTVDAEATYELTVEDVESEKLTVQQ